MFLRSAGGDARRPSRRATKKVFAALLIRPCVVLVVSLAAGVAAPATTLRLHGSSVVAQALAAASPVLKTELGIEIKIYPEGGSTSAIQAVGAGSAEVAMTTRPLTAEDRSGYPARRFHETLIGVQAVAFIVGADLWESGVRSLTAEQAQAIYEKRAKNWKEFGGADQALKFYNPTRGQGVWELFAAWSYGDIRKTPLPKGLELVSSGRDARNSVQFSGGSVSVASMRWVDRKTIFALSVPDASGALVEPTTEHIRALRYPITRPLYLVVGDRPVGPAKKLIDFMLSPRGQQAVMKAEHVPIGEAEPVAAP